MGLDPEEAKHEKNRNETCQNLKGGKKKVDMGEFTKVSLVQYNQI